MKLLKLIFAPVVGLALAAGTQSCSEENGKIQMWDWGQMEPDEPDEPDNPDNPKAEKPRYMWIDAAANFTRFADSKENIAADLQKAADAGITDVVVEIGRAHV